MIEIGLRIPADKLEMTVYRIDRDANGDANPAAIGGPFHIDSAKFVGAAELDPIALADLFVQNANSAELPAKGRALLKALGADKVWAEQLANAGGALQTYLCIDHPNLAEIPWELLSLPTEPLCSQAPLLRASKWPPPIEHFPDIWPVRVFVVNATDPSDEGIRADEELWNIRQALRRAEHSFDLEVLTTSADANFELGSLEKAMTREEDGVKRWPGGPHILHFIGHSVAGESPALKLWVPKDQGTYLSWTRAQISNLIAKLPALRLVYVNACRSQKDAGDALAPLSIAATFLSRAAAVIAMQADVRGDAAAGCAGSFYSELACGAEIGFALKEARSALLNKCTEISPAMYTPVLTTRVEASAILPRKRFAWTSAQDREWQAALKEDQKDNWKHFVNQRSRRRDLFDAVLAPNMKPGVVVYGDKEVGKTWLLRWSAYAVALHGVKTFYVQAGSGMDWLTVLRRIRDGSGAPYSPGISKAWRSEFNWKLNHFAMGKMPPQPDEVEHADAAGELSQILQRPPVNGFEELCCDALMHALRDEAKQRPLVIALDDLALATMMTLKRSLLEPLKADPRICVVLCVDSEKLESYTQLDFTGWQRMAVSVLDSHILPELFRELLRLQYPTRNTCTQEAKLADLFNQPLKVSELYQFCHVVGKNAPLK